MEESVPALTRPPGIQELRHRRLLVPSIQIILHPLKLVVLTFTQDNMARRRLVARLVLSVRHGPLLSATLILLLPLLRVLLVLAVHIGVGIVVSLRITFVIRTFVTHPPKFPTPFLPTT